MSLRRRRRGFDCTAQSGLLSIAVMQRSSHAYDCKNSEISGIEELLPRIMSNADTRLEDAQSDLKYLCKVIHPN